MRREEAIEILYQYSVRDMTYPKEDIEAFELAIKALEQEPCDCISRARALSDYAEWYGCGYSYNTFSEVDGKEYVMRIVTYDPKSEED